MTQFIGLEPRRGARRPGAGRAGAANGRFAAPDRRLTQVKFDAGAASAADAAKADAQAANTAADIPTYEAGYAAAVHRLSVLTGRAPGPCTTGCRPRADPHAAQAASVRRARRPPQPATRRARRRPTCRAGDREDRRAEAALYPDVSLTGSLSTAATRPGDLLRASSVSWSWGPSLSAPIFDAGKLAAERDATQAQRDEYLVAWRRRC